jgi:phosphoribosylaminoimidazole carboxylase PurE protein
MASLSDLPVVGLPLEVGPLQGVDALYATVQLPPGCPVGTVGIGNAKNAALLALRILRA